MANAESRMDDDDRDDDDDDATAPAGRVPTVAEAPLAAYRSSLAKYGPDRLRAIASGLGIAESGPRTASAMAGQVAESLESPRVAEPLLARLGHGARLSLGLFALTEASSWPWAGLALTLECLGVDPSPTLREMVDLGVVAVAVDPTADREGPASIDAVARLERDPSGLRIHAHPAALASRTVRTVLPEGRPPAVEGPVRTIREADGLEPVLRLAALWQRVVEEPLRQTQQGTLYKRDRERLEDDPVLAGPIADSLEPLPDMAALWLALARGVELVVPHPGSDRDVAAAPGFWADQAIHLPRMIALRWLGLRQWHEQGGMTQEGGHVELALPYLRPAALLWLATLGPDQWLALDDLATHLRGLAPRWDRATLVDEPLEPAPTSTASTTGTRSRPTTRGGKADAVGTPRGLGAGVLESLLLGAAYQFGLVRVAEPAGGGSRLVQMTPLGRYVLAIGDPPPPRPTFEHFLFVQPNFEIIAYRQGLTLHQIGEFSRFARWSQIGAALEMRLTAESVYRGLEGGLTEPAILDRLSRHSQRPLPAGVAEALHTWAARRERVIYHAAATLIEFASRDDLERGLADWPAQGAPPVRVSDRLLLVEDEAAPMGRFRITGSRNYRRAPEACLEVGADGVSLTLDLARSDLLVDAELARFADEQPSDPSHDPPGNPRRRFLVSRASLSRAAANGLSPALLAHWYVKRTGGEMPAAVRLLLLATATRTPALVTSRPLILQAPTAQWLDGLIQHPATRGYLGERLGPTAVVIPDSLLEPFRRALGGLGLSLDVDRPR